MKKIIIPIVITLSVLGLGVVLFIFGNNPKSNSTKIPKPEVDSVRNDLTHVPKNGALVSDMQQAGLEPLASEGAAMHIHEHLDIVINDKTVAIPADIGVDTGFISALHTHDGSGVLHIESPVEKDFTLGQFFKQWNVDFGNDRIGNNIVGQGHKLITAINGKPINNASDYILKKHDEIEIWYGAIDKNPNLINSFSFTNGL